MATAKKTAAKPSTAVAKPTPGGKALAAVEMPDFLKDQVVEDAGSGMENASAQDYALPFIYLLQKMSPQVDDVDGAEAGMFINTVTNELFEELVVIPCFFDKVYNEWIPRDEGGGFVASYRTRAEAEEAKKEGTQIVDTANHYCLVQSEDGTWTPVIISLTSTKLKASRNWMSKISQVMIDTPRGKKTAPSFAKQYKILPEGPLKNEKGVYYTVKVEVIEGSDGWVQDAEVYSAARGFYESVKAGQKGADYSKAAEAETVVEEIEDDEEEEATPAKKSRKF